MFTPRFVWSNYDTAIDLISLRFNNFTYAALKLNNSIICISAFSYVYLWIQLF